MLSFIFSLVLGLLPHQTISGILPSGDAHTYAISGFAKDTSIIVVVSGNGRGNIDCYLIRNRQVVASDDDNTDSCKLQANYLGGEKLMIVNNGWATDKFSVFVSGGK